MQQYFHLKRNGVTFTEFRCQSWTYIWSKLERYKLQKKKKNQQEEVNYKTENNMNIII